MLDYMAVDYPEFVQDGVVLDASEYEEQVEFSEQVQSLLAQLPAHPEQPGLLAAGRPTDCLDSSETAQARKSLRWRRS